MNTKEELSDMITEFRSMIETVKSTQEKVSDQCEKYITDRYKELSDTVASDKKLDEIINELAMYEPEHYKSFSLHGLQEYIKFLTVQMSESRDVLMEYKVLYTYYIALYYFPIRTVKDDTEKYALANIVLVLIDQYKDSYTDDVLDMVKSICEDGFCMADYTTVRLSYDQEETKDFLKRLYVLSTLEPGLIKRLEVGKSEGTLTVDCLDDIVKLKYVINSDAIYSTIFKGTQHGYYEGQIGTYAEYFIGQDANGEVDSISLFYLSNIRFWLKERIV